LSAFANSASKLTGNTAAAANAANLVALQGKLAANLVPGQAAHTISTSTVTTAIQKNTATAALTAEVGGFSLKSFGSSRRSCGASGSVVSVSSVQTVASAIGYTDTIGGFQGGMASASVLDESGTVCSITGMSTPSEVCVSGTFPTGTDLYGYYWNTGSSSFATDGITSIANGTGTCSGMMLTVTHLTDFTVGTTSSSSSSGDDGIATWVWVVVAVAGVAVVAIVIVVVVLQKGKSTRAAAHKDSHMAESAVVSSTTSATSVDIEMQDTKVRDVDIDSAGVTLEDNPVSAVEGTAGVTAEINIDVAAFPDPEGRV
jgi:hypothetical protein